MVVISLMGDQLEVLFILNSYDNIGQNSFSNSDGS